MKPTKCPAKEKINETRKAKKRSTGGEKEESKSQDCCVTFKPCVCRTSQANIWHLDQRAAKCTTYQKGFMVNFSFL